jgi:hypothetical protein
MINHVKIKAFFGLYNFLWITATNLLLNEIYDFLFNGFYDGKVIAFFNGSLGNFTFFWK